MRLQSFILGSALIASPLACNRQTDAQTRGALPRVVCRLRGLNADWNRYSGKVLLIEEFTITNNGGYLGTFYSTWSEDGAGLSGITNSGVVPRNIVKRLAAVATAPPTNRLPPLIGWKVEASTPVYSWSINDEHHINPEEVEEFLRVAYEQMAPLWHR